MNVEVDVAGLELRIFIAPSGVLMFVRARLDGSLWNMYRTILCGCDLVKFIQVVQ